MSEKVNINTKGDTNVILDDDFSIQDAGIERSDEAGWDDFELMGASNKEEGEYVAPVETNPKEMQKALDKIKNRKVGLGVLSVLRNVA